VSAEASVPPRGRVRHGTRPLRIQTGLRVRDLQDRDALRIHARTCEDDIVVVAGPPFAGPSAAANVGREAVSRRRPPFNAPAEFRGEFPPRTALTAMRNSLHPVGPTREGLQRTVSVRTNHHGRCQPKGVPHCTGTGKDWLTTWDCTFQGSMRFPSFRSWHCRSARWQAA
jgi:hypothetical protein